MGTHCIAPLTDGEWIRLLVGQIFLAGFAIYGVRRLSLDVIQPRLERAIFRWMTRGVR